MISFQIYGDKAIMRRLKRLEPNVRRKIIRKSARAAAKPVERAAKANTPIDTGALRKSVKIRAIKRTRTAVGVRIVTGDEFFKGDQFYGAFIEFGHHVGSRKLGASRRWVEGQRPLGRAFESHARSSQAILRSTMLRLINEEAKK